MNFRRQGTEGLAEDQTAVRVDTENITHARVHFHKVSAFGNNAGAAFVVNNRSGVTQIDNCRSQNCKHAVHIEDGDSVVIDSLRLGCPDGQTYEDGDGAIRIDRGHAVIKDPFFVGGLEGQGAQLAYMRVGAPGLTDRQHKCRVRVVGGRLGFEGDNTAAFAVHVQHEQPEGQAMWRSGVEIEGTEIGIRPTPGEPETPIAWLFDMPHTLAASGLPVSRAQATLFKPGGTTTYTDLMAKAQQGGRYVIGTNDVDAFYVTDSTLPVPDYLAWDRLFYGAPA